MAKKTKEKSKKTPKNSMLGFSLDGWLTTASFMSARELGAVEQGGFIVVIGASEDYQTAVSKYESMLPAWQFQQIQATEKPIRSLASECGPMILVSLGHSSGSEDPKSEYGKARDLVGQAVRREELKSQKNIYVHFSGSSNDQKLGGLVGLEIGHYKYLRPNCDKLAALHLIGATPVQAEKAGNIGSATNLCRHLVNAPACSLTPKSYTESIKSLFASSKHMKVDVWEWDRLVKNKMGFMTAVGQAAEHKSRLVHLKYRPKSSRKRKPIAFVGKGITFDTGGLDLKPPAAMRNMKKDMGGSAAVMGLAWWLEKSGVDAPCDIYLAIAENACGSAAYRPGDVIEGAAGISVEIGNTDAEGRLVLADALHVAASASGADEPVKIVNVATLTGAMKVALGNELFGFFSNDDDLAASIETASFAMGDDSWRMPLRQSYAPALKSNVAQLSNIGNTPFGGSITAALFLEKFVQKKKWAHMDIYAWTDKSRDAMAEAGASGQAVQCLIGMILKK